MSRAILGLDPGLDGAAMLLDGSVGAISQRSIVFRDYTIAAPTRGRQYDHARLARALQELVAPFVEGRFTLLCVLEQGRGQPGASSSSLSIGVGYGLLLGIIAANQWRVLSVQPSVWHRALFGKNAAGEPKARAAAFVRDQIPHFDPTLGRFKKPHSGVIDAACLALYGYRQEPLR